MLQNPYDLYLREAVRQFAPRLQEQLNHVAGSQRVSDRKLEQMSQQVQGLQAAIQGLRTTRSGLGDDSMLSPGVIRIEDIPGKRIPFILLVDIPIGANSTARRQSSVPISMEGPFVATRRWASFQSAFEAQTVDPADGGTARFAGRSYGRYRPIHSAWDINDSQQYGASVDWLGMWAFTVANKVVGDLLPSAAPVIPATSSGFRTMEFDARIQLINAGSSVPRQNITVPSSMWSTAINSPVDLGALDFFERGEVLTFEVQPTHVNNPPAGNAAGRLAIPLIAGFGNAGGFPFVEGQFDPHEGIATPGAMTFNIAAGPINYVDLLVTDSVSRLPDGILTIGLEGYRIWQPIGPVG